jgi:transposase InsO family protein
MENALAGRTADVRLPADHGAGEPGTAAQAQPPANHKRIYRIMKQHSLLLEKHTGRRPGRCHDGTVVVMRSNLRWCSDGFEFGCGNGEIVGAAFVIDAQDREVIAWRAIANAGISGSEVRDRLKAR